MKKILLTIAVLALVACSGETKEKGVTVSASSGSGEADLSLIEEKMGITICDCMPADTPPDYSNKEIRIAFQQHIDSCIALEKEVINENGRDFLAKAQENCK